MKVFSIDRQTANLFAGMAGCSQMANLFARMAVVQTDSRFIWHSDWILENLIRMSKQADRPNCEYGQQVQST